MLYQNNTVNNLTFLEDLWQGKKGHLEKVMVKIEAIDFASRPVRPLSYYTVHYQAIWNLGARARATAKLVPRRKLLTT